MYLQIEIKSKLDMMQILVEQSLADAVGGEWKGTHCMAPLAAAMPSHIALKNHALLVHRQEVDMAAAQLICSRPSLSGEEFHKSLTKADAQCAQALHCPEEPCIASALPGG